MLSIPNCPWCQVNSAVRAKAHPRFIAELTKGYVLLHEFQYFGGHSLYIPKFHAQNPRELEQDERVDMVSDIMFLRDALDIACQPKYLEVLETSDASLHTHFHLIPRSAWDISLGESAFLVDKNIREAATSRATPEMIFGYKDQIRSALSVLGVRILR